MAKTITSKRYELKEVGTLLQGKTSSEKAVIKASKLAKVNLSNYSLDGYDIEPSNLREENGLLVVDLRVFKNGVELSLSNPFQFKNPPIMVHDGTYHKGIDSITGLEEDRPNFVENPEQALKEIIVNAVRAATK